MFVYKTYFLGEKALVSWSVFIVILNMSENEIGTKILDAAFNLHRELGPGLLESSYHRCLCYLLEQRGLKFKTELSVPLKFRNVYLDCGYKLDLLVEDKMFSRLNF